MIRLEAVSKSYGLPQSGGSRLAVHEVSLEVARGEVLAVIGGSGSGKTTLLKMVNRLVEPSAGQVTVNGKNIRDVPGHVLRRSIGYAFQEVGLFPHMTVAENIGITPRLLGWHEARVITRTQELLGLVSLEQDLMGRFPRELSGGQRQRVGLARALAAEPEFLLLDEPLGALDPLTRRDLQGLLQRIFTRPALTAILVTHDMAEALLLGDRVAVIRDGRLVQVGTPEELRTAPVNSHVRELLSGHERAEDRDA